MSGKEELENVIQFLGELKDDSSVPKNVKESIVNIINILNEKVDLSIRVNKALHELDDISNDPNLQPYTRMQIWNLVSMLEKIK